MMRNYMKYLYNFYLHKITEVINQVIFLLREY
jgi:hypothetical protein